MTRTPMNPTTTARRGRTRSLALALLLPLAFGAVACSDDEDAGEDTEVDAGSDSSADGGTDETGEETEDTEDTGDGEAPAGDIQVKTFQFEPESFTVAAGTEFSWANNDDTTHQPLSGVPGSPTDDFDVVLEGKGATGSASLSEPGTYPYYCKIHESMVGEIVVE
jgi:plastocyanin